MRKKISKIVLILIIPAMYFILLSSFAGNNYNAENSLHSGNLLSLSSPVDTPKFVNMIMNMDRKNCKGIWLGNHLDKYRDSLGYNAVHVYPVDDTLYGVFPNTLNDTQKAYNITLIESVYNKNLKFFYEHVFNSYICYAQRLEYEVPISNWNNTTNYGFCYQHVNSRMTITTDSGRTVIYSPQTVNHDEVLICDSIYENLQHSDFFGRQHDSTNWYFKPMVRVDTGQLNSLDSTLPIFKIKFFAFNGIEMLNYEKIIYAYNFKYNLIYEGNYINRFYDIYNSPIDIIVPSGITTGLNTGRGDDLSLCKVDFKIYTYGYADLYFDKLTVDCEYANKLFSSYPNNYDYLIENELEYIGSNSYLYSYYMDEVTNSQIPCIKYFMDKITAFNQQHGTNIKFMVSGSNWMAVNKMRNKTLGHKMTLDFLKPRIFNDFAYLRYISSLL